MSVIDQNDEDQQSVRLTTYERQLLCALIERSLHNADYALMHIHPSHSHRGMVTVERHTLDDLRRRLTAAG